LISQVFPFADVSLKYRLPMPDALVQATALSQKCSAVTSDPHFERLEKVIFIEEKKESNYGIRS